MHLESESLEKLKKLTGFEKVNLQNVKITLRPEIRFSELIEFGHDPFMRRREFASLPHPRTPHFKIELTDIDTGEHFVVRIPDHSPILADAMIGAPLRIFGRTGIVDYVERTVG